MDSKKWGAHLAWPQTEVDRQLFDDGAVWISGGIGTRRGSALLAADLVVLAGGS